MTMMTETKCNKQGYLNLEVAQRYADERSSATGDRIEPYECPICGWVHLRNKTKRNQKLRDKYQRRRRKR